MEHGPIDLPLAPQWSLLLGSLGKGLVWAGVVCFALAILAFALDRRGRIGSGLLVAGCAAVFGTFATLATLFLKDQFHFHYVYAHSEKQNGLAYKIASIWSGQEGSFLLWATCSAIFVLLTLWGTGAYRRWFGATSAFFLGAICGILAYETPFRLQTFQGKVFQIPDGVGLSPTLNNYWVIIHPPTIFLGFGSLIVLFAYAVSALARKDYDDWLSRARPWALVSLSLLGLGLCMGGFWAYETLGWGGFWKWDPVENVSFVPWVLLAVLVHGMIVQASRGKWQLSNLLFAGLPFLLFVYGTFLTRAGFLDKVSVHSFAKMNESAHKLLLWFLVASVVGFLGLWLARTFKDGSKLASRDRGLRRDGFYRTGMVFLCLLGIATAIGMSVPLIQFALGKAPKVVEEPLYHQVLVWFFVPTLLLMAVAPFVPWRPTTWKEIAGKIVNAFSLSLFVMGIALLIGARMDIGFQMEPGTTIAFPFGQRVYLGPWMMFLGWLCAFVAVANLFRLVDTLRRSPLGIGPFVTHLGVALAMAGLIVSRGFERKQEFALQPGLPALGLNQGGPAPILELVDNQPFDFFDRDNKVQIKVSGDGPPFVAKPGLYYNIDQTNEPKPVTWPHVQRWPSHDLYLVLYPLQADTGAELTLKPGESGEMSAMVWSRREPRTYKITYREMTRKGEAGVAGTQLGAALEIIGPEGTAKVNPKLVVGSQGGPQSEAERIDSEFGIKLARMNAADKSVTLSLAYNLPVFPIELYYKPLTILVWVGVGVMTLGGFIAAWDRRRRRKPRIEPETSKQVPLEVEDDALVPVP